MSTKCCVLEWNALSILLSTSFFLRKPAHNSHKSGCRSIYMYRHWITFNELSVVIRIYTGYKFSDLNDTPFCNKGTVINLYFDFTAARINVRCHVSAVKRLLVLHRSAVFMFIFLWLIKLILVSWKIDLHVLKLVAVKRIITQTCLFKYTENFTTKKKKKKKKKFSDICSYFCSNHRLWVLVRTASTRRF